MCDVCWSQLRRPALHLETPSLDNLLHSQVSYFTLLFLFFESMYSARVIATLQSPKKLYMSACALDFACSVGRLVHVMNVAPPTSDTLLLKASCPVAASVNLEIACKLPTFKEHLSHKLFQEEPMETNPFDPVCSFKRGHPLADFLHTSFVHYGQTAAMERNAVASSGSRSSRKCSSTF